jgi:hypothetical protein
MSQLTRPNPSPQPNPIVARLGDADGPQALLAVYYQVPDVALAADLCGPGTTVFWGVENLPDACRRVERLGITLVEAPRQRDARTWTACIADPFGNVVGLMERDDPLVRRARSQRTAEKVALRNVRQKLDDLLHEDRQQKLALKAVARVLLAAFGLGLLVLLVLMTGTK